MRLFGASLFTLGLIASFVFAIVSASLIYLDQLNVYYAIGLTIIINFISWIISPALTDFFNKIFYKISFETEQEFTVKHVKLAELINKVCAEHNFKFPKIGIIPDKNPTAFTYGTARYNSRLIITEGIFEYLSENEQEAVIAHELGHIVHRDFVVMMIASTLVQILYEIYAVLIRAKGKKSGNLKLIALASYALYIVSVYLLYYLSRVRERLADEFSAKLTSPQDLSNALIKIAYGIVAAKDDDKSKRLLQSTRHLGIVDVKNAKNVGLITYETNSNPNLIAEALAYDRISPWAKLLELSSTHPLTGRRIDHLSDLSKKLGKPFSFDIDAAITRLNINKIKLYINFSIGILVLIMPILLAVSAFYFINLWVALIGFSVGLLIKTIYSHPFGKASETTILDEMRNIYASPIRGRAIKLNGKIIGKGIPGYVFSEDVMLQDKSGLTFLNYNSLLSFIGNLFFALRKVKKLIGQDVEVEGWFYRGIGSSVSLRYLKTNEEKIRSHPILWNLIISVVILIVSGFVVLNLLLNGWLPGHKNFVINGDAMNPSYMNTEEYATTGFDENKDLINRGDVVIYKFPRNLSEHRIGRVIGLSGEKLKILGGNVYINDQRLVEGYVGNTKTYGDKFIKEGSVIEIPANSYVVLGDNREYSMDSRNWGFLLKTNITNIVGECRSSCWPKENINKNFSLVDGAPTYTDREVQYWSKEASNSSEVLVVIKTWIGDSSKDQIKIKKAVDLLKEENEIALYINNKITKKEWLSESDYDQMRRYENLIKQSNALLTDLFGPSVKGASVRKNNK